MIYSVSPPSSVNELMERANTLTGLTLKQVAQKMGKDVPASQIRAKGWVGELMEKYLGATATSLSEPDFQAIGIELKTIPVGANQRPKESTYVCTVPLNNVIGLEWESSNVKRKLSRVLWVPVETDKNIQLSQRRIGKAFLWQPSNTQEDTLRKDWQEFMDMISMGELEKISSRQGTYLQIRPKAINSRSLTTTANAAGEADVTLPRGFYLRSAFTKTLLEQHSF